MPDNLILLPNQPTDDDCDEAAKAFQAMIAREDAKEAARQARLKAKKEQEQKKNEPTQQEKPGGR